MTLTKTPLNIFFRRSRAMVCCTSELTPLILKQTAKTREVRLPQPDVQGPSWLSRTQLEELSLGVNAEGYLIKLSPAASQIPVPVAPLPIQLPTQPLGRAGQDGPGMRPDGSLRLPASAWPSCCAHLGREYLVEKVCFTRGSANRSSPCDAGSVWAAMGTDMLERVA